MSMTNKKFLCVLIPVMIWLGGFHFIRWKSHEPAIHGKSVRIWLAEMNSGRRDNDLQKREEARQAIHSIGPRAFPFIVAQLKTSNSTLRNQYRDLFPKLPSWSRRLLPLPMEAFDRAAGEDAFFALGAPIKPALIIALKDNDPLVRCASAVTLGAFAHYCGTDITDCVSALTGCLQDTDANVRCCSAMTLGYVGAGAVSSVPALIPLLKDPQAPTKAGVVAFVRSAAARTLGKIGPGAQAALPALKPLLNNSDPYERSVAAIAVWRIGSDVTNTLPVLVGALNAVNEGSKWELVEGFAEMGTRAKDGLPALIAQLTLQGTPNAPSRFTLSAITNALIKINDGRGIQRSREEQ